MTYNDSVAELLRQTELSDKPKFVNEQPVIRPNGPRLLVREDEAKGCSSIIITPQKNKTRPTTGTVVAVGIEELEGWIGKRIVFPQFSGTPLYFKGFPFFRVLNAEENLGEIIIQDAEANDPAYEAMV